MRSPDLARWRALAPEIAVGAAALGGWALLTVAVAAVLPPRIVWPASIGLLLLCAGGMRFLAGVAWEGLYVLTQAPPKPRPAARSIGPRKAG